MEEGMSINWQELAEPQGHRRETKSEGDWLITE
jgi:hypothetical protein